MREFIRLREWTTMGWTRSPLLWAALLSSGLAQAQSTVDILVNHDSYHDGVIATEGPAGGTFTYRPKVKVNGSGTAEDVNLTITLPDGSQFVQAIIPSDMGVSCAQLPAVGTVLEAPDNNTITCKVASLDSQFKWVDFELILPEVGAAEQWMAFASARLPGGVVDADQDFNNINLPRGFTTNVASDLAIAISAHDAAGEIGQRTIENGAELSYQIAVTNAGPSEIPASGFAQVTFDVPAGANISGAPTGEGWTCSPGGAQTSGSYTCRYSGSIASKTPLPILSFPAITTSSGPVGAAVSVQGYEAPDVIRLDGQLGNNTANVTVTVTGEGWLDLTLRKTASTGSTLAPLDAANPNGQPVTYTLTPRYEAGGLLPTAIVVTDALPAGLTFTSFDSGNADKGWNCTNTSEANTSTIECELHTDQLPIAGAYGDLPSILFTAQATPQASGSIVNTARVAAGPGDAEPNTTNNTSAATIHFSNTAQLALSKSGPTTPIQSGEPFQYTLVVTNQGPMPILAGQSITLTDAPESPLQLTGVNASSTAGWACPAATWNVKGQSVDCSYTLPEGMELAANQSVTLVLDAWVDTADVPVDSYLQFGNEASIAAGNGPGSRDWTAVNDSANVTVSNQFADLMVDKVKISPTASQAKTGDEVTYGITVTNRAMTGAQIARGIKLTDTLAELVTEHDGYEGGGLVATVPGNGNTCSVNGNNNSRSREMVCDIDDLAPGESTTVTVTIRPRMATAAPSATTPMQFTNTATVRSDFVFDNDLSNNRSSADINLTTLTEIGVVKQVTPENPAAGQPVKYTLTVQNHGPSSAQAIRLVDALPENLIVMGNATAAGAACFHSTDPTAASGDALDGKEGGFLICTWAAPLSKPSNALGQFLVTYQARPKGTLPQNTVLNNTVIVSTTTEERGTVDNTDAASITLQPAQFDVQIEMRHSDDGLAFGEETEYTIIVTNAAASTSYATGVNMLDIFPAELVDPRTGKKLTSTAVFSYQDGLTVTPMPGNDPAYPSGVNGTVGGATVDANLCTAPAVGATSGQLDCTFPLMAPGDRVEIKFKMRAESILDNNANNGTILHDARVSAIELEAMPGYDASANNTTSDRTSTNRRPAEDRPRIDAALTKEGPGGFPKAGDALTYVITVSNHGTNTIPAGGRMIDTLPDALTVTSVKRDGQDVISACLHTDNELDCPLPEIVRGASVEFVLETTLNEGFTGPYPLVNSARVAVDDDGDPSNNEDDTSTDRPTPPVAVPSLTVWSIAALSLLMLALMGWRQRQSVKAPR